MVRAGSSPGGQRLASASSWLFPPVLTAAAVVVTVTVVSPSARLQVALVGAIATLAVAVAAAEAVRRGRKIASLHDQLAKREAELKCRLAEQEAETVRLAETVLPEVVSRVQKGEATEDVLGTISGESGLLTPEFEAAHQAVQRSVVEFVVAEADLRESAQRAFVNIARRVQAIIHQQAHDLRQMEDRHGNDPKVFDDLLHLDHGTALIGRLADSIAVLSGARPGRQWQQSMPLFRVLRGAMSRIVDYQRVELHSVAEVAVVGTAVEPLIHALAELLDNATRYSPPQTRVHLTASEVQSGVAVEIEDGGVGLSEEARNRAERVLQQASTGLDLSDLGETPRLGLAVVGRLAQANNFKVSLRPSAYAGVRAVLVIPQELITSAGATPPTTPTPAARSVAAPKPIMAAEVADSPTVTHRTANGLPQRRRRNMAAPRPGATPSPVSATSTATGSQPSAQAEPEAEPGMWLAAFQSGISGEGSTAVPARHADDTLDEGE